MRVFKHELTKKQRLVFNGSLSVLIGLALFGLGWFFGSGNISVKRFDSIDANNGLPADLDYSSVETIYDSLRENFDGELDEAKLIEGIKSGLANATGDPYTEFFNPKAAEEFSNQIDGTFEGIGAELGKDANDNIVIVAPIAGYPAEKAGIRPKDIIAEVDDESTDGWSTSQAVDKIRGDKGTAVKLTIIRDNQVHEISIVREKIDIPSVKWEVRDGIGIVTISRFGDDTSQLTRQAAEEFKAANVRGVVLDLRSNPGGYLDAAVDVSSIWLEKGKTVLTERRDNVVTETMPAEGNPVLKGIPTVVLINEGSASASEITAGALRDNDAATLMGQKSYGKGSVQQTINLRDGGLLKVTIARWFTPGGKNIDHEGVGPDEEVKITEDDIKNQRDPQLEAALSKLKN